MRVVMEDWLAPWSTGWPDPGAGPWVVTLRWRAAGDRAECIGLDLQPVNPEVAEPMTATLMRSLPVAGLIARARQERYEKAGGSLADAVADGQVVDVGPGLVDQLVAASQPWEQPRKGRPVDLTPDFYAEVAEVYSAALLAGTAPLRAVEQRWTTSRPTASRWVAAARRLGLLPETQKGRARGADVTKTEGEL